MSATITWVIEWMQCYPQEDGKTDVVITAGWRCNGAQTSGTPPMNYNATSYGTCGFTLDPSAPFTPYADLTQDQVLGWCWAGGVDKASIEANVQAQIDNQINPPVIQPPLPWAPAAA